MGTATHVAGTIASYGSVSGVMQNATWFLLKCLTTAVQVRCMAFNKVLFTPLILSRCHQYVAGLAAVTIKGWMRPFKRLSAWAPSWWLPLAMTDSQKSLIRRLTAVRSRLVPWLEQKRVQASPIMAGSWCDGLLGRTYTAHIRTVNIQLVRHLDVNPSCNGRTWANEIGSIRILALPRTEIFSGIQRKPAGSSDQYGHGNCWCARCCARRQAAVTIRKPPSAPDNLISTDITDTSVSPYLECFYWQRGRNSIWSIITEDR